MSTYNDGNMIDLRDVMARVEELEEERDGYEVDCPQCGGEQAVTTPEGTIGCDVCDVAGQVSGVEASQAAWAEESDEDAAELTQLAELLGDLAGAGGDEQWRGEWYPVQLIHDDYFATHARELAEDCGMVKDDATWPNNCIDWEKAADQLKGDYTLVTFDGDDWWYR